MIVPIYLDTSSLLEQYSQLDQQSVDSICDNIAKTLAVRYAAQLELEAQHSLNQTRKRYIQAINVVDTGRLEGTVILDFSKDPLIRMIEEGASAFDMKTKMLASPKAKTGADGRKFITIPFRYGSPDIVGDSDVFSINLPSEVYEVVKGKETNIPTVGGKRSEGLTVKELPVQFQSPSKRAEIKDSEGKVLFKEYTHRTPLFAGVTKNTDSVTGQNTYSGFRRVAETDIDSGKGSDPDAWIHKGIEQYNLVSKALSNFNQETEVQVALNREFEKLNLM